MTLKTLAGGPDAVTRLAMVLAEEGLEWATEFTHDGRGGASGKRWVYDAMVEMRSAAG